MASITATTASPTPTKSLSSVKPRRPALADITNESSPVVGLTALLKTPPAKPQKPFSTGESLLREQEKKWLLGTPAADAGETAKGDEVEVVLDAFGPTGSLVDGAVAVELVCSPLAGKKECGDEAEYLSVSSSVLTYEDSSSISSCGKYADDDCSSAWSVQANASCLEEEAAVGEEEVAYDAEEEIYYEVDGEDYPFDDEEEEQDVYFEYDDDVLDNLCKGMARLGVSLPTFAGKHTRFVYNSDGEIAGEEEVVDAVSPSKVVLKGIPVPQGKHLRFSEDDASEI